MEETMGDTIAPFPDRVGDRLRTARMSAGMELSDIAQHTRVPLRHLEAIERSDFSTFPSDTYVMGFVRAYVRAVGEDEAGLMHDLRMELGRDPAASKMSHHEDLADPARIPPRSLAAIAALIIAILALGYTLWQSAQPSDGAPAAAANTASETPTAVAQAPSANPAPSSGTVTLIARGEVWLRITDADDKVLFEGTLQKGDSYAVPANAKQPVVQSAMARMLDVSIGTAPARSLTNGKQVVKSWPINPAALREQARQSDAPPPARDESPAKPEERP
jgi:cytoskeleton protein RodZ